MLVLLLLRFPKSAYLDGDLVHVDVHLVVDALAVPILALKLRIEDLQGVMLRFGR